MNATLIEKSKKAILLAIDKKITASSAIEEIYKAINSKSVCAQEILDTCSYMINSCRDNHKNNKFLLEMSLQVIDRVYKIWCTKEFKEPSFCTAKDFYFAIINEIHKSEDFTDDDIKLYRGIGFLKTQSSPNQLSSPETEDLSLLAYRPKTWQTYYKLLKYNCENEFEYALLNPALKNKLYNFFKEQLQVLVWNYKQITNTQEIDLQTLKNCVYLNCEMLKKTVDFTDENASKYTLFTVANSLLENYSGGSNLITAKQDHETIMSFVASVLGARVIKDNDQIYLDLKTSKKSIPTLTLLFSKSLERQQQIKCLQNNLVTTSLALSVCHKDKDIKDMIKEMKTRKVAPEFAQEIEVVCESFLLQQKIKSKSAPSKSFKL